MDTDASGSSRPDTQTAVLEPPGSNYLQISSYFDDSITGYAPSSYRQQSPSLDLCGFSCDSNDVQRANGIIDLRQSSGYTTSQKGFCTNPSCILPSPPLTGSDLKRTVPLPHVHTFTAPHHHARFSHTNCSSNMHPNDYAHYAPPSPPLTIPLGSQSLPDTGDHLVSNSAFSQPSSSRASSVLERQSTLDSPELLTPVSPAWHFPSSSKSELGCILQDPLEFESEPQAFVHDLRSPPMQPASLPPFEDFPGQSESWEARRLRQPELHSFPGWSNSGDAFESDSELDEELLRPPESPRPRSMSMDLPPDDFPYAPHHTSSELCFNSSLHGQSSTGRDPLSLSIDSLYSSDREVHPPPSARSPVLRLRACLDSDESFSSMESVMPTEENEYTSSLTLPPMPSPLPSSSSSDFDLPLCSPSPSRRSFTSLPDPDLESDNPYCPTPLASLDSPSRRSFTALPEFDNADEFGTAPFYSVPEPQSQPQWASPRQTLLSLPGVDTDEELFPPIEPDTQGESETLMQTDNGLLLHHPADGPSRDDEAEVLASIPLALRADPEVRAIASLRGRLLASERHARTIESAFAGRVAQTGKALLACTYSSRQQQQCEDDYVGFDVMAQLRRELKDEKDKQGIAKRVRKKEKERGREVGALLRLKVAQMTGPGEMDVDEPGHVHVHGHGHKGKHRDCCGHGGVFTSVHQLVAKMVFKRRESYRPLTNRRANPFRRSRSPLPRSVIIADFEGGLED